MQIIELIQGSLEWHAHRAKHFNASDAPAMMGESKYETRTELVKRLATGVGKEIDAATQKRFDDGHAAEAKARPYAESIVGETLYPIVGSEIVDGLPLSASFDGITMLHDVCFEHKSVNDDIRVSLDGNSDGANLPAMYRIQMEQQLMLSGAEKCIFMATAWNGDELLEQHFAWYLPDMELRARIIAGWKQLAKDVADYQPTEHAERPAPEVQIELPALFIQAQGGITSSNMEEYGKALAAKLAEVRAIKLVTDQDFSNAKQSAAMLREQCAKMKLTKEAMLSQTVTIGEAVRMMDAWSEDMRLTALQLEKDVEREDLAKKRAMVSEAGLALSAHIQALESETRPIQLNLQRPDFAGAIKNKRNYASMQDALDTALANAKIEADAAARDIRQKLEWFNATDSAYKLLFPDLQTIIQKPAEDFRLTVDSRINEHKQAEEKRLEAERERIRKEEEAKAQREAEEQRDRETPVCEIDGKPAYLGNKFFDRFGKEFTLQRNSIGGFCFGNRSTTITMQASGFLAWSQEEALAKAQQTMPPESEAGTPAGPGPSAPASVGQAVGGQIPRSGVYAVHEQRPADIKLAIDAFFARVGTPKAKQANYRAVIMAWEEFKAGADMEQAA